MSAKGLAFKYVTGRLRGDRDTFAEEGRGANTVHAGHHGGRIAMHSAAPPPAEEYEAWLEGEIIGTRGVRTKWTGTSLRRAVLMKRNGCDLSEIGRAVGIGPSTVCNWLNRLPEGLRP